MTVSSMASVAADPDLDVLQGRGALVGAGRSETNTQWKAVKNSENASKCSLVHLPWPSVPCFTGVGESSLWVNYAGRSEQTAMEGSGNAVKGSEWTVKTQETAVRPG